MAEKIEQEEQQENIAKRAASSYSGSRSVGGRSVSDAGSRYEVILHDLSHVESSIVAIGGNVTNRRIGGPRDQLSAAGA